MAETLSAGGDDVLMLVPEIAFTAQLVERMERVFGSRVTAYHSKLTVLRRTETYMRLLHSEGGELVVGTRSALFLPLRHLRMIVVDEEHDASYKQSDTSPRYNGARLCRGAGFAHGGQGPVGKRHTLTRELCQRTVAQIRIFGHRGALRRGASARCRRFGYDAGRSSGANAAVTSTWSSYGPWRVRCRGVSR